MSMEDDDLFAELCGISASTMEVAREDDGVVMEELCRAVERATLQTQAQQVQAALDAFQHTEAARTATGTRIAAALALGKLITEGQYAEVVRSAVGQRVVTCLFATNSEEDEHVATHISRRLDAFIAEMEEDQRLAGAYEVFFVGIAFFNLFVQANYTGPALEESQLKDVIAQVARVFQPLPEDAGDDVDVKKLHRDALIALQVDGENPFTICDFPFFLAVGRAILHFTGNSKFANWSVSVEEIDTGDDEMDVAPVRLISRDVQYEVGRLNSAAWWNARAAVVHERLMISREPSNTLWFEVRRGFFKTLRHPTLFRFKKSEYFSARAHVEWGLAQNYFDKNKQGKRTFEQAHEITGLSVQLSGSMGKRTKFQQKSTAQMVLLAASKYPPEQNTPSVYANAMAESTHADFGGRKQESENEGLSEEEEAIQRMVQEGEAAYRNVHLDQVDPDNILLEHIAFEDKSMTEQGNLQTIDQVILLALCLDVKNSNANDGLTREEMFPYVTRVLENPNNWMVYSTGLLERAWLECETSKRRERGVLQMQALVDQHTTRLTVLQNSLQAIEDAAPAHERMEFVHALAFPPRYALKRDLSERYLALGVIGSALEICLELEIWDDVVKCYQILEQSTKAEKIVRERLAVDPSPYMWTCLGDITEDISHYETAWELSKHRFARAKRSLGRHFFEKGDYKTAIAHYQDSVQVSPMNNSAWFVMGSMAMRVQDWDLGLRAFTRVVQLEPDNGEALGNIGSIHIRSERYAEAFSVLQEALKQKREMWQMWENYSFCALHIERFGEAMYGVHQWLDLRHKHKRPIDHELLAWLVESIVYPERLDKAIGEGETEDASVAIEGLGTEEDDDIADLDEAALATDKTPQISNASHKKQLAMLFGRITSVITNNPKIWQVYAHFNDGVGRKEKALDCRLKQCRALQTAGWETTKETVDELCKAAVRLSEDYMADGTKKALYSCRLYIRGVLKKAQVDFAELEAVQALAETLAKVEAMEKQL
ncbi:hypothetical protein Poli38472_006578 [Pythium oligandrum]|uniref:Tetratricopeptide repeat n=1 Tax=Pythium oligandrum TaxID=41045 RepID=A0A8K1C530_PYTOL|nr:hypothetical protein Poli38472_006578 [Pythium oligandrum]|eukprot:TMW56568.1 hypothetical protein Poli38472_006578 [Pythium oligandrum]